MADKWEWEAELKQAHLTQSDVAKVLRLSKSQMSHLVKKMIAGQGLTATELDNKRWESAIEFVHFKQSQLRKDN